MTTPPVHHSAWRDNGYRGFASHSEVLSAVGLLWYKPNMRRAVLVGVALLAPLTLPVVASAETSLATLPPVVTLTSDASSITATITNPNEAHVIDGYTRTCEVAVTTRPAADPVSGVVSFANQDPFNNPTPATEATRYPQAGQTVTLTMGNLVAGQYSLAGECGQLSNRGGWLWSGTAGEQISERVTFTIQVKPKPGLEDHLGFGS